MPFMSVASVITHGQRLDVNELMIKGYLLLYVQITSGYFEVSHSAMSHQNVIVEMFQ